MTSAVLLLGAITAERLDELLWARSNTAALLTKELANSRPVIIPRSSCCTEPRTPFRKLSRSVDLMPHARTEHALARLIHAERFLRLATIA
jgi:hypothetical protein